MHGLFGAHAVPPEEREEEDKLGRSAATKPLVASAYVLGLIAAVLVVYTLYARSQNRLELHEWMQQNPGLELPPFLVRSQLRCTLCGELLTRLCRACGTRSRPTRPLCAASTTALAIPTSAQAASSRSLPRCACARLRCRCESALTACACVPRLQMIFMLLTDTIVASLQEKTTADDHVRAHSLFLSSSTLCFVLFRSCDYMLDAVLRTRWGTRWESFSSA